MTDEKQIEEMARVICNRYSEVTDRCRIDYYGCNYTCSYYDTAKTLYEKNFRKLPKNAVVLTKEKCENCLAVSDLPEYMQEEILEVLSTKQNTATTTHIPSEDEIRKETAREILNKVMDMPIKINYGLDVRTVDIMVVTLVDKVNELAKQYGVEVEE